MSIVPLLLLCSLALVVGAVVLFVWSARQGDCHESERLCLLPLEDDADVRDPGDSASATPSLQKQGRTP
ncbi:MAG: cbb3-type cytochrome oxidase assembly protein CcoS [Planctomycetes bacterium]|nr:cbb3-type cytochrome oxidase assembly protein CcoS [Planctomycetota bacterium]